MEQSVVFPLCWRSHEAAACMGSGAGGGPVALNTDTRAAAPTTASPPAGLLPQES